MREAIELIAADLEGNELTAYEVALMYYNLGGCSTIGEMMEAAFRTQ